MFFGEEGQGEEYDRPRAWMLALTRLRELLGRKRDTRGLTAGLRSKQGQVERYGIIRCPARGLCRNRDNGATTQEVLLEYCLSFEWRKKSSRSFLELGKRGHRQINGF